MMNNVLASAATATTTTAAGRLPGDTLASSTPYTAIQLKKELDEHTRSVMARKLPPKRVFKMPNNIYDTSILYDEHEDGFLREGPARLLGMTPGPDGSWTREPLDDEEAYVYNIAALRDTASIGPDSVTTATASDDNDAAVAPLAVELHRQDVCPVRNLEWYVVHSIAMCFTDGRDDRFLLTTPDREPAASSPLPLAEDEVETCTSSRSPSAEADVEIVGSSQSLSEEGEEESTPLSRPTSLPPVVGGEALSGGSGREQMLVHGGGTRCVSPTHDDVSFLGPVGVSCVWVDAGWLPMNATYEDDTQQQGFQQVARPQPFPRESTTVTFCISVYRDGGFHVVSRAGTTAHSTALLTTSEHLPPDDCNTMMGACYAAESGMSRKLAAATSSNWGAILVPTLLAGEGGEQITTPCGTESGPVDRDNVHDEDDEMTDDENFCFFSLCYWLTNDDICCFYSLCYWLNTTFAMVMTTSVMVKRLITGVVTVLLCALGWASVLLRRWMIRSLLRGLR